MKSLFIARFDLVSEQFILRLSLWVIGIVQLCICTSDNCLLFCNWALSHLFVHKLFSFIFIELFLLTYFSQYLGLSSLVLSSLLLHKEFVPLWGFLQSFGLLFPHCLASSRIPEPRHYITPPSPFSVLHSCRRFISAAPSQSTPKILCSLSSALVAVAVYSIKAFKLSLFALSFPFFIHSLSFVLYSLLQ